MPGTEAPRCPHGWRLARHRRRAAVPPANQEEFIMHRRQLAWAALGLASAAALPALPSSAAARDNGIVTTRSDFGMDDTVNRIVRDIAAKKIRLFNVIDQSALAREAGVDLGPSTLIVFGNPPLGTQFLTANPVSGLDWPVRLLVYQDSKGQVWTAYNDFSWVAKRHDIRNRKAQFKMASEVIRSIVSSSLAPQGQ
jgi:uncharacterized protein (DUF302 family)